MKHLIESFIDNMTELDILKYAEKNNLYISDQELKFIYNFIKKNHKTILANPSSFDITPYKNNLSNENYIYISKLIDKYKRMII